jgi:hypothetical protein
MNLVDIYDSNPEFVRQLGGFRMMDAKTLRDSVDAEGNTLLHKAAVNNDMTTFNSIKTVLPTNAAERNNFMNMQNLHGDTAAHIAVRNGNHAMVTAMKNMGANLTIANKNNEYILSESEGVFTDGSVMQNIMGGALDADGMPSMLSSTEPYNAPVIPSYDSPAFSSPGTINMYSSDDVFLSKQHGGFNSHFNAASEDLNDPASLSDISTEDFVIMGGGKKIHGVRTLYFDDMLTTDSDMFQDGGKKLKESSQMHEEAVRMIMDMGYSEDDARTIKAAIYKMVKDKYGDLNNLERARKMIENINSSNISQIDINEVREAIRKNREAKGTLKGKKPKESKEAKPKKTTAKKTSAKKTTAKKSSKKTSKRTR